MRDEKVIRDYRNALKKLNAQPCECRGTVHAVRCQLGGMLAADQVRLLTWLLGEDEGMGEIVAQFIHDARELP